MNRDEAARRVDAMIAEYEEQLNGLKTIRDGFLAGDCDTHDGRLELIRQVRIHTRQLWQDVKSRREFELVLLHRMGAEADAVL